VTSGSQSIAKKLPAMAAAVMLAAFSSGCAMFGDLWGTDAAPDGTPAQLSTSAPTEARHAAVSTYDIGKVHFNSKRYGLAIDSFQKELRHNPKSLRALNAVAATYDMLGRTDLADRYYEEALAVDPDSAQTLNNFGYSYLMRGRQTGSVASLAEAERLFRLARGRDGANLKIEANLGYLSEIRGNLFGGGGGNLAQVVDEKLKVTARAPNPYAAWIERKSRDVQYLVSSPPVEMARKLKELRLDPAIAGYASLAHRHSAPGPVRVRAIGHPSATLAMVAPRRSARPVAVDVAAILPRSKPRQIEPAAGGDAIAMVPKPKPRRPNQPTIHLAALIQPSPKAPRAGQSVSLSRPDMAPIALDKGPSSQPGFGFDPQLAPRAAREMQIVVGSPKGSHRVIVAEQAPRAAPLIASAEGQ